MDTKLECYLFNALVMCLDAMEYLGNILNNHDMTTSDDIEKVTPAFEEARSLISLINSKG